jgi:hypothetical protein
VNVGTCPVCHRDFIPSTCSVHCGAPCCRKDSEPCPNVKPAAASNVYSARFHKKCIVCGKGGLDFVRFAPCNKAPISEGGCNGTFYDNSERPNYGSKHQWGCFSETNPEYTEQFHRPTEKPRFHIKYCSLACYNAPFKGHQAKVQAMEHRKWTRRGKARQEKKQWMKS